MVGVEVAHWEEIAVAAHSAEGEGARPPQS